MGCLDSIAPSMRRATIAAKGDRVKTGGGFRALPPWNFPFWQVIRFAAPSLMAGNAVVLKHAPNVSGCAVAIEDLMLAAGFPAGLFRTLLIDVPAVAQVIEHPDVRGVTLTGSARAGRAVAGQAAALVKKTVLELGGSDPSLILEDADLEAAAISCATSRMINSGQSCVAAKRFVVVEEVRVANDTAYGLGASVYTRDTARGERIAAHDLEAGCCFVNGLVKSDPRLPFGGVKESGYGRELAAFGLREFVNVKTVWVA